MALQQLAEQPSPKQHGKSRFKSVDAAIMELADDIAYGVHDLEDAIVVGLITRELWMAEMYDFLSELDSEFSVFSASALTDKLFSPEHYQRKRAIGSLVNRLVTSAQLEPNDLQFESPLLQYKTCLGQTEQRLLDQLKSFIFRFVIRKPEMQVQEFKGQQVVMEIFDAFAVDPLRLLPVNTQQRYLTEQRRQEEDGTGNPYRIIADYLSGMTDAYAARLHQEMFSVNSPLRINS